MSLPPIPPPCVLKLTNISLSLVARKQPELAILQLLGGDYHQLAKTSLLKVAWFKFDRFNPTVSFSSSYKYLDCIQRLSVNFRDLYVWTTLKVNQPAKHFIPFETAQIWARRKSLRILKVTNHFMCTHDRFVARSVRERIGNALDSGIRSNRGEGVRDIIKLGRERVSDSCDLILELSFSLYGDEPFVSLPLTTQEVANI